MVCTAFILITTNFVSVGFIIRLRGIHVRFTYVTSFYSLPAAVANFYSVAQHESE